MSSNQPSKKPNLQNFKKYQTEVSLNVGKSGMSKPLFKRQSLSSMGTKQRIHSDLLESSSKPILTGSHSVNRAPPPFKRQESTLSRTVQQTKALMRRKTEVLIHDSTVEGENVEDKFRQLTLKRMQTRGRLIGALLGPVKKERLDEFRGGPSTDQYYPPQHDPSSRGPTFRDPSQLEPDTLPSGRTHADSISVPFNRQTTTHTTASKFYRNDTLGQSGLFMRPPIRQSGQSEISAAGAMNQPYGKESVAAIGWKALKATISGVSVIKQLIPQPDDEDEDHDVFRPSEGTIDHRDDGMGLSFGPGEGTISEQPEPDSRELDDEDDLDEEDDQVADTLLDHPDPVVQPTRQSMRRPTLGELSGMKKEQLGRKVSIQVNEPLPVSPHPHTDQPKPKMKRLMSQVFSRRDKRYPGLGFVSRCMGRARKSRVDSQVKQQLDEWQDHRPFFTWYVSSVQVMVLLVGIASFGVASFGLEDEHAQETVEYQFSPKNIKLVKKRNFYFGPKFADLIRLGAKYAPCMRRDRKIMDIIGCEQQKEQQTACCKYGNKCIQASKAECDHHMYQFMTLNDSTWMGSTGGNNNWHSAYQEFKTGSVCGLDPFFCDETHTEVLFNLEFEKDKNESFSRRHTPKWRSGTPDDITRWPKCSASPEKMLEIGRKNSRDAPPWMTCNVNARPCCIGTEGQCKIVSKEYCDTMEGKWHGDAFLCSQVDCLKDTCGLIPFLTPFVPDQIYRLHLSLFIHAGILHLCITLFFQMVVLRDLEKLAGWWRIALIYILSGMVGNLASAIFVPYKPDVGPSGAQYGLIACLFVEFIQSWQLLDQPWHAVLKLAVIAIFLFLFGLLPWVDNYAHIFGFISGILLSFALLPYIVFGKFDQGRKMFQALTSIAAWLAMTVVLLIVFYYSDFEVENASLLTCISLVGDQQDETSINFCKEHLNKPVRYDEFWEVHDEQTWINERRCVLKNP
ncbi:Oidioi.mRNA.OKI2018_I69.chr2.g8101.t1.cds [Oikopleura dioica]|uniref:Oidioi.mRNA.OKI2018_I69.chr2.g8101.t1.cds n=1 Tax=Oikopleura dioica TaxID=34765 RepID=A0ABN7TBF7_OIKDI|nr:Oidioi.mRNA.OKI2018_I69.chr2.g8101.t1.cds [Oikopleura dioica]